MVQATTAPAALSAEPIPREVRIGHIHLNVSDLERSIRFYCDTLGFDLVQRWQDRVAFLSTDGYHHHIALNSSQTAGATAAPSGHTGMRHVAFVYPSREAVASACRRLLDDGVDIQFVSDHGVTEAVYFEDPDGNGLEIYWDRPIMDWEYLPDGTLHVARSIPMSLEDLIAGSRDR